MDKIIDIAIVRGADSDDFIKTVKSKVQEKQRDNQAVTVQYKPTFDHKRNCIIFIAIIEVRG